MSTMVQCNMPCFALTCRQIFDGYHIQFFTVPKKPTQKKRRGKYGPCVNKKKAAKTCQNEAWMSVDNFGLEKGFVEISDPRNIKTCIAHFHPSVFTRESRG